MRRAVLFLIIIVLFSASRVHAQRCEDVCVEDIHQGNAVLFYVNNRLNFPVEITFTIDSENLVADTPLPFSAVYEAKGKTQALKLLAVNQDQAWKYSFTYEWQNAEGFGAIHDNSYAYRLPYGTGTSHVVGQGFNGRFSHLGEYAIDWDMPEKTPIHAAREGRVIVVEVSHRRGGVDQRLQRSANYILILHPDGSIGSYSHLSHKGSVVNVGEVVERGQHIGYSGNTGYSSGPHLHFETYVRSMNMEKTTIPIKFETKPGKVEILREGEVYEALN